MAGGLLTAGGPPKRFVRAPMARWAALLAVAVVAGLLGAGLAQASGPVANGKLVLSGGVTDADLYTAEPGGEVTPLMSDAAVDSSPAWSPDGTQIAFARDGSLFVVNQDGTGLHAVLPASSLRVDHPAWSPDGTRLAFEVLDSSPRGDSTGLDVVNVDGTGLYQLTSTPGDSSPTWSPDGSRIAFANGHIFSIGAGGTGRTDLTPNPPSGVGFYTPDWSPDGSRLAIQWFSFDAVGIAVMPADGSAVPVLLPHPHSGGNPVWSPDGTKILYLASVSSEQGETWVMNADGSGQTNVSPIPAPPVYPYYQTLPLQGTRGPDWQPVPDGLGVSYPGLFSDAPGAGVKFGSVFTLGQAGTTDTFRFYASGGTAAQTFVPVVYLVDANGNPTTLVARGAEVTVAAGQAPGWVVSQLPAVALGTGKYFLGVLSGPVDHGASIFFDVVPHSGIYNWNSTAYPNPTPAFGAASPSDDLLSVQVTTTTAPAPPPPGQCGSVSTTDTPPAGFDSVVYTTGCGSVSTASSGDLRAEIDGPFPGASDDRAFASVQFGGSAGLSGLTAVHDRLRVVTGAAPTGNLPVLRVLDVSGNLVYELYIDSNRLLNLWSPAGGLRATSINLPTGIIVPLDTAQSPMLVDVFAEANNEINVYVDGESKIALGGLSGATTANQRTLQVGILGYLGTTGEQVAVLHGHASAGPAFSPPGSCIPHGVDTIGNPPTGFDSVWIEDGCGSVTNAAGGALEAQIISLGSGSFSNRASADRQFGGAGGLAGLVTTHDHLLVKAGASPTGNLPVVQVLDVSANLVYELYLDSARVLHLWSPPGGLQAASINQSTGVVVPLDTSGLPATDIAVTAQKNNRVSVVVDGVERIGLTGLAGATSGFQETLRAGIEGYLGGADYVAVFHSGVSAVDAGGGTGACGTLQTSNPPAGYDGVSFTTGCQSVGLVSGGELEAKILGPFPGPTDRQAYATKSVGGAAGLAGLVIAHDHVRVEASGIPTGNLPVFQSLDVSGNLVYELYLDPSRVLHLWSPAGGLRAASINLSSGVVAPLDTDSAPALDVTVTAAANDRVIVNVNGVDEISVFFLAGATTGNQQSLRAGIIGYLGTTGSQVAVLHSGVAAAAAPPVVLPPPAGYDSVFYAPGAGLVQTVGSGELEASIIGPFPSPNDQAYAVKSFGGAGGLSGLVTVHDHLRVEAGHTPNGNLPVLQVLDTSGNLVYELYLDGSRVLHLWSPNGGLRASSINLTTGVTAPLDTDAAAALDIEVTAKANDRITVTVNGTDAIVLTGLAGATTGSQQTIHVGINHYDGHDPSPNTVAVLHSGVSAVDAGPGTPPPPVAPTNTALPTVSGSVVFGQTLTASQGTWAGSPATFDYTWRRCDGAGARCVDVGTGGSYTVAAADIAKTIRVLVTATNAAGTATALSATGPAVPTPLFPVPAGFDAVVSDASGGDCADCTVSPYPGGGFQATVGAGVDSRDTAYAVRALGGIGSSTVSDSLLVAASTKPTNNVSVLQVRDVSGGLVYELYLTSDRVLHLWSPAGGLGASAINITTGIAAPIDDGSTAPLQVTVTARANSALTVVVNGSQTNNLTGLSGATTGNQDTLRVGIDHYDSASSYETLGIIHESTSVG